MTRPIALLLLALTATFATASPVAAFCGFYVARAGSTLFNKASQVVLARDGDRTVLRDVERLSAAIRASSRW